MRWATYDRQAEQFDRYEAILDYGRAARWQNSSENNIA
jgi:hypothetical protein